MSSEVNLQQLAIDRSAQAAPSAGGRRHLLTRYVLPALLLFGLLGLLVWASWDFLFPPRRVTVAPVLATHSTAQSAGTPLFKAAGWIEPRPTPVRVPALASGVVEKLLVVEDQAVAAGEAVAELVKDDARLAVERAQADLALREAEHEAAHAALEAATTRYKQPVHLQAALGEAQAMLARANTQLQNLPFESRRAAAQLQFAEGDLAGKKSAGGAVSGRAVDQAQASVATAQALVDELERREASLIAEQTALTHRRDALQTRLKLLADELQARDEAAAQLKATAARVEQARVALAQAQLALDRMTVRAPIAGRVFRLVSQPGSRFSLSGQTDMHDGSTVVTMYRPDSLQVRVDVRFEDLPRVQLSQPVRIENPALSAPLTGQVLFVGSEADIQKNTLEVKVAIERPPSFFKPEMLVDVTFLAPATTGQPVESSEQLRLYAPQQLIERDEAGPFVWLADQTARRARKTPVELGAPASGGMVEVKRGLTLSSRLIAGGGEGLRDGDSIRVTGEREPPARETPPEPVTREHH